jgi:NADH-quinone oxidoreductase subunit C
MPDEPKPITPPPPGSDPKPTAEQPAAPGGVTATASGSVQSEPKPAAEAPSPSTGAPGVPAAPEKPAAAAPAVAAKPAAPPPPPKPVAPPPAPWDSPMVARLKSAYGSGIEPLTHLGQNYLVVDRSLIPEILQILFQQEEFDYCVDITAVHYPKRDKQFDVIWVLYSYPRNERIRVKTMIAENETVASSVPIWVTANWLEREIFDMFGIKFDGHPDLKRILLPDGWKGHPLRKDYDILKQDTEWVQINLGIESGQ